MRLSVDGLMVLCTVVTLGLVGYRSAQPDGALGGWVRERQAATERRNLLNTEWDRILSVGQLIGDAHTSAPIVEFADYECPFCRQMHPVLEEWLQSQPGSGVIYIHFPLPSHPQAPGAAAAAICAGRQERFHDMHVVLMTTAEWRSDSNWVREASQAGVSDIGQFTSCLTSAETLRQIEASKELARKLAVSGTPSFFGRNGKRHLGVASGDILSRLY